ncbi:MAG: hypothetical protein D6767_03145 [Candidatus Hydrogenedentota bacterium]|nr:MAG: hypothetical protein D6767_03145 [Candidatus Hydrogenedentota bacterium]
MSRFPVILTFLFFLLAGLGLSALLAASNLSGDSWFYFRKQAYFMGIGIILFLIAVQVPWDFWLRLAWPIYGLFLFLLVLVFIPGIGKTAGGASRWIAVGPLSFQPSDGAKIATVFLLARLYGQEKELSWGHIFVTIAVISMPILLIGAEPDFSTAFHLAITAGFLLFLTGFPLSMMTLGILSSLPLLYQLIIRVPYRRKRVLSFLDPWGNRFEGAWQLVASLKSFKQGAFWGEGLGEGVRRHALHARHTDFILSVVAEDTGFAGVFLLLSLYFFCGFYALWQMQKVQNLGAKLLGIGLVLLFLFQTAIHIGVTMGLLPTTGISLPLASYGGSSLLAFFFSFGVVVNILRKNPL